MVHVLYFQKMVVVVVDKTNATPRPGLIAKWMARAFRSYASSVGCFVRVLSNFFFFIGTFLAVKSGQLLSLLSVMNHQQLSCLMFLFSIQSSILVFQLYQLLCTINQFNHIKFQLLIPQLLSTTFHLLNY